MLTGPPPKFHGTRDNLVEEVSGPPEAVAAVHRTHFGM